MAIKLLVNNADQKEENENPVIEKILEVKFKINEEIKLVNEELFKINVTINKFYI